jgi:hypothetical protein
MSRDEELTVSVVSAVGGTGLQAVVGLGLLRCTPGDLRNDDLNVRGLVPVALSNSCEGAVQGALLAIGCTAIFNILGMLFVKHQRTKTIKVSVVVKASTAQPSDDDHDGDYVDVPPSKMEVGCSWWEAASLAMCPSITLAVASLLQMGLIVCGGRMIQDGLGVALGMVGVLVGLVLFPLFPFLVWLLVSRRCYQLAPTPEAPAKLILPWLLPCYVLDSDVLPTKAFSHLVFQRRYPHFIWAMLPVLQPTIMFFPTMAAPGYCSGLLLFAAVFFALVGAIVLISRPYFIAVQNITRGSSLLLTAIVVGLSARLAMRPGDATVASIVALLAMAQTAVSVVQILHSGLYLVVMKLKGDVWFRVTSPSLKVARTAQQPSSPLLDDEDAQNAEIHPIPVFNVIGYLLRPKRRSIRSNGGRRVSDTSSSVSAGGNNTDNVPLLVFNTNPLENEADNLADTPPPSRALEPYTKSQVGGDVKYDDSDDDLLDNTKGDNNEQTSFYSRPKGGETFASLWGANYKGYNPMVLPYDRENYSSGSETPLENDDGEDSSPKQEESLPPFQEPNEHIDYEEDPDYLGGPGRSSPQTTTGIYTEDFHAL